MATLVDANARLLQVLNRAGVFPAGVATGMASLQAQQDRAYPDTTWLGQQLVDDGLIGDEELARVLARELHLLSLDLSECHPDPAALALLDADWCRRFLLVPLCLSGESLTLAMANPLDRAALDQVKLHVSRPIDVTVAPIAQIQDAIELWYRSSAGPACREALPLTDTDTPVIHRPTDFTNGGPVDNTSAYPHTLVEMLSTVVQRQGSDLHLTAGSAPLIRIDGTLKPMELPKLRPHHVQALVSDLLTPEQQMQFSEELELDFSFGMFDTGRFRVNVFVQRGSIGAIFRVLPTELPTLHSLGLPEVIGGFTALERGLVLITGPTGSGKSTTLAAMINEMNRSRHAHIVTLEDPIEYVHWHGTCEINQRQVGLDTKTFLSALKHVLRQDPDIILIGELRDYETVAAAMTAAETGHLVLSTLHTNSAAQTIDRIIDVFPPNQQSQMRSQLASVLEGVVSQRLIPRCDGPGRVCAQEILVATPAVRTLIRDAKTHQIPSSLESGKQFGMQTMDRSLMDFLEQRIISLEDARKYCADPEVFKGPLASYALRPAMLPGRS